MRAFPLALGLLTTLPLVLAGSAGVPEASDPAGDAVPDLGWNDLTSAWFEDDAGDLVLGWSVASYDGNAPFACWNLDFRVGATAYAAIVQSGQDSVPQLTYYPAADPSITFTAPVAVTPGAPATFRARLSHHHVPIAAGDVAQFRLLLSCSFFVNVPPTRGYDQMANGGAFVVPEGAPVVPRAPASHEGTFLVGGPVAYAASDACSTGDLEGVDSNCVDLTPSEMGNAVSLVVTSAALDPLDVAVCYYDEMGTYLGCSLSRVPAGAVRMGVSALGGAVVSWRVDTTP